MTTLDDLRIVAPCGQDWARMPGDARRRHCAHCDKHVHDLSARTRSQAQALLARGGDLCVRVRHDVDGHLRFAGEVLGAVAIAATAMACTPTHRDDGFDPVPAPPRPADVRGPMSEPAPDPMPSWPETTSRGLPLATLGVVMRCIGIESPPGYMMGAPALDAVGVPDPTPPAPPRLVDAPKKVERVHRHSLRAARATRRAQRLARAAARKAERTQRRAARRAKWRAQRLARKQVRANRRLARRERRVAKCLARHRPWCRR